MHIAQRAHMEPSATLTMAARAKALKAQGRKVISLAVGEPDFPTPPHVRRAAAEAVEKGYTRYTPVEGLPEVREAVARNLARRRLRYDPSQVVITAGAKQALANVFLAVCDPGDEVIVPAPYWVSYPDMIRIAGATPVFLPMTADLGIDPDAVKRALTPRTRALVICTPSNPTGHVLSEETLRAIEAALPEHVLVVSDEIYSRLVYDGARHVSFAELSERAYRRTVVVDGVSKTYCMTGWRIGWAAGPKDVIDAAACIQGHMTSNASAPGQMAAKAALEGDDAALQDLVAVFDRRRRLMIEACQGMEGVRLVPPRGAFYVFPDVSERVGRATQEVAAALLEEASVAVVAGEAFGAPGFLRLSYGTSDDEIREAMARLKRFLDGRS